MSFLKNWHLDHYAYFDTFKYHVFAPMERLQLELIYFYFPPSSHLIVVPSNILDGTILDGTTVENKGKLLHISLYTFSSTYIIETEWECKDKDWQDLFENSIPRKSSTSKEVQDDSQWGTS